MAWSTRELAELAGTSLRAVRHYHDVGLLDEPARLANGYKQYGVAHLVRLVRIKRLTDLGFSLPQIAAMGDADDHPEEALRTLDAELAAGIERLQRARVELGVLLRKAAPTDLPPGIAPAAAAAGMPAPDRSFLVVASRVLGPQGLQAYTDMLQNSPADAATCDDFEHLPADAGEETRRALAERMAPFVRALYAEHPGLNTMLTGSPHGPATARQAVDSAIEELYNPAQFDVLIRTRALLAEQERKAEER